MSEEVTHEKVQDSHETKASNNQESPSEPNYKQEMMKYKTQRNEEREKVFQNVTMKKYLT